MSQLQNNARVVVYATGKEMWTFLIFTIYANIGLHMFLISFLLLFLFLSFFKNKIISWKGFSSRANQKHWTSFFFSPPNCVETRKVWHFQEYVNIRNIWVQKILKEWKGITVTEIIWFFFNIWNPSSSLSILWTLGVYLNSPNHIVLSIMLFFSPPFLCCIFPAQWVRL